MNHLHNELTESIRAITQSISDSLTEHQVCYIYFIFK